MIDSHYYDVVLPQRDDFFNRTAIRDTADCSVIAVAIVCGIPYGLSHLLHAYFGRRHRKGTPDHVTAAAIRACGYRRDHQFVWESSGITSLERELRKRCPWKRFLISTGTHLLAFDGSDIADWSQGKRHRIKYVWPIVKGTADWCDSYLKLGLNANFIVGSV